MISKLSKLNFDRSGDVGDVCQNDQAMNHVPFDVAKKYNILSKFNFDRL